MGGEPPHTLLEGLGPCWPSLLRHTTGIFFKFNLPPEQISGYGPAVGARKLVAQDWCGAKFTEKKFGAEIRRRKNELSIWVRRHNTCLVPRFFMGKRVGQRGFLQVLVPGIVTNRKQKILSQVTWKILFKPTGHFYSFQLFYGNL